MWADTQTYVPRKVDFYDKNGLLKQLISEDIREIDGRWTPMKMTMSNMNSGSKTILATLEIQFDVPLEDALFSTSRLKRR